MKKILVFAAMAVFSMGAMFAQNNFRGTITYSVTSTGSVAYQVPAEISTAEIKVYDDNGKPVKLLTWKKTNLVGKTARQKAKERAEGGESLPR